MPINPYLAVACLAGLLLAGRAARVGTWQPNRLAAALQSPWAPPLFGLLTLLAVRFVWRSFAEPGVVHDERAYLLQAEIFARGHWTAPPPPVPAFFEQMHVFLEPGVFAKYPPAHAMMLVPGVWLGMPGLMPAVMAGVAGALTFWLARRLSNVWIALVTWLLWTTAPVTLLWSASYFSENTTTVMWLAACAATILWLDSDNPRYLVVVAAALAWGVNARPLTMLALGAPLGFVIVRRFIATGRWRTAIVPGIVGVALLGVGPLWNHETLGRWTVDPYSLYSRTYFPFDKPGFGVDPAPPLRPLPPEFASMSAWSQAIHADYVPSAVPKAFVQRVQSLISWIAVGWRLVIGAMLIAALLRARGPAFFALGASACLMLAYLTFAHPPDWVVYYVELLPALHFLAAGYLIRLLGQSPLRTPAAEPSASPLVARSAVLATALLVPFCVSDLVHTRMAIDARNDFHRRAEAAIRQAPPESILFVRYPPSQDPHRAITRNEADLPSARSWVVFDRGADDASLASRAPDRRLYVLDVSTWRLEPFTAPATDH